MSYDTGSDLFPKFEECNAGFRTTVLPCPVRKNARSLLEGAGVSQEGKILGLAALDIFDLSGGTFLGEAISVLSAENFTRLANAIKALRP
ncbi:MAG: hypothetical protein ACYTFG_16560 [Planctomycetota bacterium]